MLIKRTYPISYRIFTQVDIENIVSLFWDEYIKFRDKKNHSCSLDIRLSWTDGSEYTISNSNMIDEKLWKTKRVTKLHFSLSDFDRKEGIFIKNIIFQIENGSRRYNELTISGTDNNWVDGSLKKFSERIEAAKPQFKVLEPFEFLLILFISYSFTITVTFLITKFSGVKQTLDQSVYIALFFLGYIFASLTALKLPYWFPEVEIQIGPTHTFIEANKRRLLYLAITSLLLPVLLQILI